MNSSSFSGHGKTPPVVRVEPSHTIVEKKDEKGTTGGLSLFSKEQVVSSQVDRSSVVASSAYNYFSESNVGASEQSMLSESMEGDS